MPHATQQAPSFSGAPHSGQRTSRTSPQQAHRFAHATGDAILRKGWNKIRLSTTYGTFDGQLQFGQKPLIDTAWHAQPSSDENSLFSAILDCSSEIPKRDAIFFIASSESFVPSPASNMDNAGCLQPNSAARADCDMPFARRACPIWRQISGERFFK